MFLLSALRKMAPLLNARALVEALGVEVEVRTLFKRRLCDTEKTLCILYPAKQMDSMQQVPFSNDLG